MQESDFTRLVDALIVNGQASQAKRRLGQWLHSTPAPSVERAVKVTLASLCRRAGAPDWGVRLLNPEIRAEIEGMARATDQEKTEYGACLSQIGAIDEAERILAKVDPERAPPALLFRAFCLFAKWDYAAALPLLRRYLPGLAPASYALRVGQVNLASTLAHCGLHDEALALCRELIEATSREGRRLLQGNAQEILGRVLLERRQWPDARRAFDESRRCLAETGTVDFLFLRRWEAVLELRRQGASPARLARLREIREEAWRTAKWETARDCDLHLALSSRDPKLLRQVYFGTPFPAYRRKVLRTAAEDVSEGEIREQPFVWASSEKPHAHRFDVHAGLCSCGGLRLKPNQLLHRLLQALGSDYYRPQVTASLFGALYPGEYFDFASSPVRVRQALKRLRAEVGQPPHRLEIWEDHSAYRIVPQGRTALVLREAAVPPELESLQSAHPSPAAVSADEAGRVWGISSRSALRRLKAFANERQVSREGKTRGSRYRIGG